MNGKPYYPNVLLVSGTGRNVGKTSLACRVIEKLHGTQRITAVKISPHLHEVNSGEALCAKYGQYAIFREEVKNQAKDSSRLLTAGARRVFYMQAIDNCLPEAWSKLREWLEAEEPVIIESGGIHKIINPGCTLFLGGGSKTGDKPEETEYPVQHVHGFDDHEQIVSAVDFKEGHWKIIKQ